MRIHPALSPKRKTMWGSKMSDWPGAFAVDIYNNAVQRMVGPFVDEQTAWDWTDGQVAIGRWSVGSAVSAKAHELAYPRSNVVKGAKAE